MWWTPPVVSTIENCWSWACDLILWLFCDCSGLALMNILVTFLLVILWVNAIFSLSKHYLLFSDQCTVKLHLSFVKRQKGWILFPLFPSFGLLKQKAKTLPWHKIKYVLANMFESFQFANLETRGGFRKNPIHWEISLLKHLADFHIMNGSCSWQKSQ